MVSSLLKSSIVNPTYHVQVHESNSKTEIVLVENSLELVVEKMGTSSEAATTPRVKRPPLELQYISDGQFHRFIQRTSTNE